jgi:hypothetical protein
MTDLNAAYVNDPGNRAGSAPPCGCPEGHEPFCDIGRLEEEKKVRQLLRALRTIARGEVSGFELQQIAIRTLTEFNEVKS